MFHYPPLKERIFKVQSICTSKPASHRPSTYKYWSEDKMEKAFEAVTKERLSVRRAAEEYNVPRSTLGDRVSGRTQIGARSGPMKILTDQQEDHLEQFLINCAAIGYAKSRSQVIDLMNQIYKSRGIDKLVTNGWWESFCKRHPNVTLRAASLLSKARTVASDPSTLNRYFDILEETLDEYQISQKPHLIFNMDETGMPLEYKPPKGVFARGEKHPVMFSSGNKSQITVVGCVSAAGFSMPPMVILDRKHLPPSFSEGEIPGTIYGLSVNGWIDQELFDLWFRDHFLKYAPATRPLLLLIDGHKSHYNPETIKLAAEKEVILFTLPPNTTHLAQPLDRSCFGPLKNSWKYACQRYIADNPGKVVTRFSFSKVFNEAWTQSMTNSNIIAGFRVSGIYPFNRNALLSDPEPTECKLPYLPLLTPSRKSRPSLDKSSYSQDDTISDSPMQSPDDLLLLPRRSSISDILQLPTLPEVNKATFQKASRVLTSEENLRILDEKKKEKERIANMKAERKAAREAKKAAQEAKKAARGANRAAKKCTKNEDVIGKAMFSPKYI